MDTLDQELAEPTQLCKLLLSGRVSVCAAAAPALGHQLNAARACMHARFSFTTRMPEWLSVASWFSRTRLPSTDNLLPRPAVPTSWLQPDAYAASLEVRQHYPALPPSALVHALERYKEVR